MTSPVRVRVAVPVAILLVSAWPGAAQPPRIPAGGSEARAQHLAVLVSESDGLRAAVIRGNLEEARAAARRVDGATTRADFAGLGDAKSGRAFQQAARAIVDARDVDAAARGLASLAAACGDCHRSASIRSALRTSPPPELGGVVGHMLQHQQAADELHAGLVEPSDPLWRHGADVLATAPLKKDKLPHDPKLTGAVYDAERRAHELGTRAREATDRDARVDVYAQFLASCAECHRLHDRIWGPGVPR